MTNVPRNVNSNASRRRHKTISSEDTFYNINFSNSGTKTLSALISTIAGTVTIQDAAILDAENHTFGGSITNITMTGTSEFRTAGTGVR